MVRSEIDQKHECENKTSLHYCSVCRHGQALRNFVFLYCDNCWVSIIRVNRSNIFIIDRDHRDVSSIKVLSILLEPLWSYTKNISCYGISKNEHLFAKLLRVSHFLAKRRHIRLNVLCESCSVSFKLSEYQIMFDE